MHAFRDVANVPRMRMRTRASTSNINVNDDYEARQALQNWNNYRSSFFWFPSLCLVSNSFTVISVGLKKDKLSADKNGGIRDPIRGSKVPTGEMNTTYFLWMDHVEHNYINSRALTRALETRVSQNSAIFGMTWHHDVINDGDEERRSIAGQRARYARTLHVTLYRYLFVANLAREKNSPALARGIRSSKELFPQIIPE